MEQRRPILGTWSILDSPSLAEVVGGSGLDFQILDMEHGPFDLARLGDCIRASEIVGCAPLVRVSENDPAKVQSALDLGANGVIIPQIAGLEAARVAVASTRLAPLGTRGFNPFTRAGSYSGTAAAAKLSPEFAFVGVILEKLSAFAELDAIAALPGLDLIYLGAYDISAALGCHGQLDHPKVKELMLDAIPKIRRAGKSVGVMVKSEEETRRYIELGANFLVYGVDTWVIRRAYEGFVSSARNLKF